MNRPAPPLKHWGTLTLTRNPDRTYVGSGTMHGMTYCAELAPGLWLRFWHQDSGQYGRGRIERQLEKFDWGYGCAATLDGFPYIVAAFFRGGNVVVEMWAEPPLQCLHSEE
jgi:hypothetical protein